MPLIKNTKVGNLKKIYSCIIICLSLFFFENTNSENNLVGKNTNVKILDKISSKNELIKLTNGEEYIYKDLSIKSMKCTNSKFDDNPEIIAYLQVKDQNNRNNDEVFVFNGWTFSSSPTIKTFDHPVYDLWLIRCY